MRSTRFFGFLILAPQLLLAATPEVIDWTPRLTTVQMEGAYVTRLCFASEKRKYAVSLDTETKVEGANGGASFTYPKFPSARFTIRNSPIQFQFPLPEDHADFRKAALSCAPLDAIDVNILEETNNPLPINQWKSYRVTLAYTQYGRRVQHSITLLALANGQEAILEISAFEKEYQEAFVRSNYLIRTWHSFSDEVGKAPTS